MAAYDPPKTIVPEFDTLLFEDLTDANTSNIANNVNILTDDTNGDYSVPFVKTGGAGAKPLYIDGTAPAVTINPSTASITANRLLSTDSSIRIGTNSGLTNQGTSSVAVGVNAGRTTQGSECVAVGVNAGNTDQRVFAVAVGRLAGQTTQGQSAVAVGVNAGQTTQGLAAIAIGSTAGNSGQGTSSVAIGNAAGQTSQGVNNVAIGLNAGQTSQSGSCVAIGASAGQTSQGGSSVAIGVNAAVTSQGNNSIAIGQNAGQTSQGAYSVAIGALAGQTNQHSNTIVINATTATALNTDGASRCFIDPLRVVNDNGSIVKYNRTTKEMTQYGEIATYPALDPYSSGADAVSTWVSRTSAADNTWNSICWSPSLKLFCAVAGSGTENRVMTSPDGINWTTRTTGLRLANCVNGLGNAIVSTAVSGGTLATGMALTAIVSGGGTIPAGTTITTINSSTLITITTNNLVSGLTSSVIYIDFVWRSVCWSQELSRFVAVGEGGVTMTSTNGTSWTINPISGSATWTSVVWSPELKIFVAVNSDGGANRAATSTDGSSWTLRGTPQVPYQTICWSPQLRLFVAVANSGTLRVMTSPDGSTWTPRTPASTTNWTSVCWSPELGLFAAVSGGGLSGVRIMVSADGINWIGRNTTGFDLDWRSICWSPQLRLFVATSSTGTGTRVLTSPDSITWTLRNTPANNEWYGSCWSPELGIFCAVSTSGTGNRVMTSTLKARPPTTYNVFNSPFNSIDENGVWTLNTPTITYPYSQYANTGSQTLTAFTANDVVLNTNIIQNITTRSGNVITFNEAGIYKIGIYAFIVNAAVEKEVFISFTNQSGVIANSGIVCYMDGSKKTSVYGEFIYNAAASDTIKAVAYAQGLNGATLTARASPDAAIAACPSVKITIYKINV